MAKTKTNVSRKDIAPRKTISGLTLTTGVCSIIGKRDSYEDRVLLAPDLRLFAVADGMGGHPRGDEAAQTAVNVLRAKIEKADSPSEDVMRDAIKAAHKAVAALATCSVTGTQKHKLSCDCRPPGTTLTALWFASRSIIIGHVGDCRVYRWAMPGGEPEVLTREHRQWRGLSKHLGDKSDQIVPDVFEVLVEPGHVLLVATDGLWESMRETLLGEADTLAGAVYAAESSQRAYDLVQAVRQHSSDNITALLIDVGDEE